MRSGVIAQKLGMTRVFTEEGAHVPVTVLRPTIARSSPTAPRTRTATRAAAGLGHAQGEEPHQGRARPFRGRQVEPKRKVAEFRVSEDTLIPVGAEITADHFVAGPVCRRDRHLDRQGLRRRHEALELRRPARLARRVDLAPLARFDRRPSGSGQDFKNKKMPGHMGVERVTTLNLEVVQTDVERGLILVEARCRAPRAAGSR